MQELQLRNVGTVVEEDQPVELIEATESDRSTGFSDQCGSAQKPRTCVFRLRQPRLAGWRNAHPRSDDARMRQLEHDANRRETERDGRER